MNSGKRQNVPYAREPLETSQEVRIEEVAGTGTVLRSCSSSSFCFSPLLR